MHLALSIIIITMVMVIITVIIILLLLLLLLPLLLLLLLLLLLELQIKFRQEINELQNNLIYASTQSHSNKNDSKNDNDKNTLGSTDEASNPEINDDNSSKINELLKQLQEVSTAKEVRCLFNL